MIIGVLLGLITLPGTLYLLCLTTAGLLSRRFRPNSQSQRAPDPVNFAVVIPAHNEGETVLTAIESLNRCHKPRGNVDIVVVADNCTDDTAAIAGQAGCRVLERLDPDRRGKGYALRYAFDQLQSENHTAYIVIDADTRCEPNLVVEFEKYISAGADAVQAPYLVDGDAAGMYARVSNIGFRAFNYLRPAGRDFLGLSAGILGTGFALTRRVLDAVPYTADSIVEDLEYHIALVRNKYRSRFAGQSAVYSAMPETEANSQAQRSRWEGGRMRMIIDNALPLIREIILGRWRLLEPLLELLMLPLWIHVSMLTLALVIGATIIKFYALIALAVVVGHVVAAVLCTGGGLRELSVFFIVPRYILWKFGMVDKIADKAVKSASWDRTGRD